jgi:hypothetical protein
LAFRQALHLAHIAFEKEQRDRVPRRTFDRRQRDLVLAAQEVAGGVAAPAAALRLQRDRGLVFEARLQAARAMECVVQRQRRVQLGDLIGHEQRPFGGRVVFGRLFGARSRGRQRQRKRGEGRPRGVSMAWRWAW